MTGAIQITDVLETNRLGVNFTTDVFESNRLDVNFAESSKTFLRLCVKSVRIRSFAVPYFPAFGLNTEKYSVSL